jgi:hypothetical protein
MGRGGVRVALERYEYVSRTVFCQSYTVLAIYSCRREWKGKKWWISCFFKKGLAVRFTGPTSEVLVFDVKEMMDGCMQC